jgi:hypothetical protein
MKGTQRTKLPLTKLLNQNPIFQGVFVRIVTLAVLWILFGSGLNWVPGSVSGFAIRIRIRIPIKEGKIYPQK